MIQGFIGGIIGGVIVKLISDKIPKTIQVKYFTHHLSFELKKIENGDWIDLRASKEYCLKKGDRVDIPLGIAMKLPKGYEALLVPRSSTCRKFNIFMENSIGIIDNSYCGNNDQWNFRAIAMEDTLIPAGTRIAQFRIIKSQPKLNIRSVKNLSNKSRGGLGSTGTI